MTLATPILHTARLRLRPFTDADADPLFALHSSTYVMRYWDSPPWTDRARAERFIAMCRTMADEGTGARVAIDRASDGAFVGWCVLAEWNPDYRSASLGYCLAEAMWGHGYATEAAHALLQWAFDTLDLNRIQAPGPRLRAPPLLLRFPRLLGDDPRHDPTPHRRERPHLARRTGGGSVNIRPLLDALDLQEDAARALAEDLRTQIDCLQTRLREAKMHLENLAITRKIVTGLADRLPAVAPDLPEHPDCPRILAAFNHATGPLRAKDGCEALGHELLPKNVEGTRAKLKRLVKLGILTEADTGNFARKQ